MDHLSIFAADDPLKEILSPEKITAVLSLLPGLLTYLLVKRLGPRPDDETKWSEAAIWGLASTVLVYATWDCLAWVGHFAVNPTPRPLWGLVVIAVGYGLLFARMAYSDFPMARLRKWRFTRNDGNFGTWNTAFRIHDGRWIIVTLKDDRRIMGYPRGFTNNPPNGHLLIELPRWLHAYENAIVESAKEPILIDAADVRFIQFFTQQGDPLDDKQTTAGSPEGAPGNPN